MTDTPDTRTFESLTPAELAEWRNAGYTDDEIVEYLADGFNSPGEVEEMHEEWLEIEAILDRSSNRDDS